MKQLQLNLERGFRVIAGTSRSQAATMVLAPGTSTGGPHNKHDHSDQWLYVISGRARAMIEGAEVDLSAGELLLIEAGERHEIVVIGDEPFETVNIYTPPEY